MTARTRSLIGVAIISVLLALYFVFIGVRAVALIASATPIAVTMGIALIVLPLLGVWALWRELHFGRQATKLVDRLATEGRLPEERVDVSASGRPDREQAREAFPRYRDEAEASPESWQAWMRLGIVYDACGDRKRARAAIREAIALHRTS